MKKVVQGALFVIFTAICVVGDDFEYDEALAKQYLPLSSAPYCYQEERFDITDWSVASHCIESFPNLVVDDEILAEDVDGYGFVGHSDAKKLIVIAVKGTTPTHLKDIMLDVQSVFTFPDECEFEDGAYRVHAGFCREYRSLKRAGMLDSALRAIATNPDYKIVLSGHSLGGAIVTLFGLDLMSLGHSISLFTYGQPRTGASEFADRVDALVVSTDSDYFRITHYKDPVAHLPCCKLNDAGECKKDNLHPYHSGVHVHYPEHMDKQHYTVCGFGDTSECLERWPISVNNHRYYFETLVSELCCPPTGLQSTREAEWEELSRVVAAHMPVLGQVVAEVTHE